MGKVNVDHAYAQRVWGGGVNRRSFRFRIDSLIKPTHVLAFALVRLDSDGPGGQKLAISVPFKLILKKSSLRTYYHDCIFRAYPVCVTIFFFQNRAASLTSFIYLFHLLTVSSYPPPPPSV